jgi:hypothetical protein
VTVESLSLFFLKEASPARHLQNSFLFKEQKSPHTHAVAYKRALHMGHFVTEWQNIAENSHYLAIQRLTFCPSITKIQSILLTLPCCTYLKL